MNRSLLRLLPALAAIAAIVPAALAAGGRGPDGPPLLPDLDQETPSGLVLTQARGGWRLGFDSAVRNIGAGPLIIDGERLTSVETMTAEQVVVHEGGLRTVVTGVGRLRYVRSRDHRHWHLLGFDRYELRRANSDEPWSPTARAASASATATPCARASSPRDPPSRSSGAAAGSSNQACQRPGGHLARLRRRLRGESRGSVPAADGLRSGRYLLVHRVNADHRIRESAYDNNASSLLLTLRRGDGVRRMRVLAVCPDTEHCSVGSSARPFER